MNVYSEIDSLIRDAIISGYRRFCICPMGANGMLTKQILIDRYGIKEEFVADNMLTKYNNKVIAPAEIPGSREVAVILNTTNKLANAELSEEINSHVRVFNILEPTIIRDDSKEHYFSEIRKLLRVKQAIGHSFVRLGRSFDGGYVMLDDFQGCEGAISIGISDDVSWDLDVSRRNIDVFQFDHTIACAPVENKRFHFYCLGVAPISQPTKQCITLDEMLTKIGLFDCYSLILKMDVEGTEWDVINNVETSVLRKFKQIALELHGVTDVGNSETIISALTKLNETHVPVWVHGNNYASAHIAGNILIPTSLEICYARIDDYVFEDSTKEFPLDIDMPNCAEKNDFTLGVWG